MKLYFASRNEGKINEVQALCPERYQLQGIGELVDGDLPEDGTTLEENARQKAELVSRLSGADSFADDTGLEVFALNMEPGVFSARYAGEQRIDEMNIAKLIHNLRDKTDRRARFRTVIAYTDGVRFKFFEGIVNGTITESPRGNGGFGYDSVFVPDGETRTFAEMNLQEKNRISHRGRAIQAFVDFLKKAAEK